MVAYMRQEVPNTQVLILGILPRGSWTLPDDAYAWPNRLTDAISIVNNASQVCPAHCQG